MIMVLDLVNGVEAGGGCWYMGLEVDICMIYELGSRSWG